MADTLASVGGSLAQAPVRNLTLAEYCGRSRHRQYHYVIARLALIWSDLISKRLVRHLTAIRHLQVYAGEVTISELEGVTSIEQSSLSVIDHD